MLEVTGCVDRESSCYLAGETVCVKIFLNNLDKENGDVLGWICLQMHCDRIFPKGNRNLELNNTKADVTSVKPSKEAIFSSKPDIILCNWSVPKATSEVREREMFVPLGFPPTFKGQYVRYNWYLQVAIQRVDKPIQTLFLPIRVLNSTVDNKIRSPLVQNPFVQKDGNEMFPLSLAMARIEEKTVSSRKTVIFDVTSGGDHFATVNLNAGPFKLGDIVQGMVEFPDHEERKPRSIQLLVSLETVEECLYSDSVAPNVVRHNYSQITTAFLKSCHFRVPIQLTSVPTFTEQSVKLFWRIHFEFTVTRDDLIVPREHGENLAENLRVQALSLDHPIFVHSANPLNVGMALHNSHHCTTVTL
ncbi:unnamed protein product [Bursaphelenchus xylophilus]|uniref:(pine wood nematode) hypothetical protein n=1 Tax=Bursaphelenchus xylophilus TaxID=6326 RepID=A0A1I7STG9_BURXY|nr:unnamed protein product [Bursaphelenchus xylophilus]CAG9108429.1 unnamed protein product [Bursaphelenchus xylophilus]